MSQLSRHQLEIPSPPPSNAKAHPAGCFEFGQICSTGRFKGDVSFGSIVVENGGKLEGKVNFAGAREPMPEGSDAPPTSKKTPADESAARPADPVVAAPVAPVSAVSSSEPAAMPGLTPVVDDGRQSPE